VHAVILIGRLAALELAGLTLLDRLALTAAAAGCPRVFLIGVDAADSVSRLPARTRTAAEFEPIDTSSGATGIQVAALTHEDRLLVLHSDLALAPTALRAFIAFADGAGASRAVVAVVEGPAPDHPAAVPVTLGGGIAHTLGLAVVPGAAAEALAAGPDGLRLLLSQLVRPHEAQGTAVFRTTQDRLPLLLSAADGPAAERSLIRSAGKESDGLVSRLLNRRISGLATRLLLKTGVAPNTITWWLLALGVITGLILLDGSHAAVVLGTLLYQINSMLDGCDGEIARLRFESSRFGAWADTMSDQVTNLSFFLALPLGLYRRTGDTLHLSLALFVMVGVVTLLAAVYLKSRQTSGEAHFSDYGRSIARAYPPGSLAARTIAAVSTFLRRDSYALLFFLLALAGADKIVVYLIAAGVAVHLVSLLLPARGRSEQST
jgi:phosphatidylglycerophosphate synthase